MLVWTAFNFLGITFERFGSLIKRKMDHAQVELIIYDYSILIMNINKIKMPIPTEIKTNFVGFPH